jgi:hypothetical protein
LRAAARVLKEEEPANAAGIQAHVHTSDGLGNTELIMYVA